MVVPFPIMMGILCNGDVLLPNALLLFIRVVMLSGDLCAHVLRGLMILFASVANVNRCCEKLPVVDLSGVFRGEGWDSHVSNSPMGSRVNGGLVLYNGLCIVNKFRLPIFRVVLFRARRNHVLVYLAREVAVPWFLWLQFMFNGTKRVFFLWLFSLFLLDFIRPKRPFIWDTRFFLRAAKVRVQWTV